MMHIISNKSLLVICFIAIPPLHSDAHFGWLNQCNAMINPSCSDTFHLGNHGGSPALAG